MKKIKWILPRSARRTRRNFDELSNRVIGLVLEVYKQLGAGLLEIKKETPCTSCACTLCASW